ncbi:hypothetical protein DXT90_01295 [Agrobacterium tumefaciens]|uniref:Uncharacterized protein n=1 Tax=Rhizobium rhizogenes TaxID=359 RepID=A0AA92C4W2_RHIRH|nr:hypothetical protein [Agrobacterium tumefaciens]PVE55463.1 hypothetical protein DC430_09780 [Rhizobium rhizogenes]PVE65615.1 hypothetical protein DC415_11710 [Agrobacterium tumefaciens]PVE75679.1 hypothetical protein DCP16_11710 [Sphingomonas sp. TPD3009]
MIGTDCNVTLEWLVNPFPIPGAIKELGSMEDVHAWTSARAKANFDQLLEAAKTQGPQSIRDESGSFTLRYSGTKSHERVTDFLIKGLPED